MKFDLNNYINSIAFRMLQDFEMSRFKIRNEESIAKYPIYNVKNISKNSQRTYDAILGNVFLS